MSRSFTLIELLIVIAIIAVLSVVVILALNPAELLKQARDSNRLSDIDTVNRALSLLQTDIPSTSFGTASTTYISVGDNGGSSSCANVGISTSTLPSGWTYGCAASSTLTKVNATGWIPVNFSNISSGSPLSNLPKDPVNTTSSNNYYTYVGNNSNWALSALLESQKYLASSAATDGGYDPGRYEKGSNLALMAQEEGLVGWWTFDEGSGTTAVDSSGNGNAGTLTNGPTWTSGCKIGGCLSFNGLSTYVSVPDSSSLLPTAVMSYFVWAKQTSGFTSRNMMISKHASYIDSCYNVPNAPVFTFYTFGIQRYVQGGAGTCQSSSAWVNYVATYDGNTARLYVNGVQVGSSVVTGSIDDDANPLTIGEYDGTGYYFNGLLDDARVYSRALTPPEIAAIYNATK